MVPTNNPIINVRSEVNPSTPLGSGGSTPQPATTTTPTAASPQPTTPAPPTPNNPAISSAVPAEFTASSYAELIPELQRRMDEYKPLSEEDLRKLRRRQRAEGIISGISDAVQSVANLIATHHYAPNMFDPKNGMSAKAQERFDKAKAERDADKDRWLNYALTIGKMRDADKDRGLQAWQITQNLARQDRAYDDGRADRAEDVRFRNERAAEGDRQWQAGFDRQGQWRDQDVEFRDRQFQESIRQFNVTDSRQRYALSLQAQSLAHQLAQGQVTFNLGAGHENVTLTRDKFNDTNVSHIFETLPMADTRRKDTDGKPIMARGGLSGEPIVQNGFVVGYKKPTTEAMLVAIGAYLQTAPGDEANPTRDAIRRVAGTQARDHANL